MAGQGAGHLDPSNANYGPQVSAVVTALGASQPGYTTYQVSVTFDTQHVDDVYALYGDPDSLLIIPPAMQVPTPFGSNVGASNTRHRQLFVSHTRLTAVASGPVNAAFFAVNPAAQYDSFLTIGMDGPALNPGALSSVGLEFDAWDESAGINSDNGAVFFMV